MRQDCVWTNRYHNLWIFMETDKVVERAQTHKHIVVNVYHSFGIVGRRHSTTQWPNTDAYLQSIAHFCCSLLALRNIKHRHIAVYFSVFCFCIIFWFNETRFFIFGRLADGWEEACTKIISAWYENRPLRHNSFFWIGMWSFCTTDWRLDSGEIPKQDLTLL